MFPFSSLMNTCSKLNNSDNANMWCGEANLCLVLLCDQNSFGRTKMVLVWPNWFGLDHNDLSSTKMKWSGPNCDLLSKWITFGPEQFILVVTISFWSWPNHYGQAQINLVRPKPFWTDQNCFGHIEGQGKNVLFKCQLSTKKIFLLCE